jgi:hypothetical protein
MWYFIILKMGAFELLGFCALGSQGTSRHNGST